MNRLERIVQIDTPQSAPQYELRVRRHGPTDTEYEIWQVPSAATPQLKSALRVAGLRGRNLELVEHRVLRRLARAGVRLGRAVDDRRRGYTITEDLALTLGLIFRTMVLRQGKRRAEGAKGTSGLQPPAQRSEGGAQGH